FLGRGQGVRSAIAVFDGQRLSKTVGTVLDTIFAIRRLVRVAPVRLVPFALAATRSDVPPDTWYACRSRPWLRAPAPASWTSSTSTEIQTPSKEQRRWLGPRRRVSFITSRSTWGEAAS